MANAKDSFSSRKGYGTPEGRLLGGLRSLATYKKFRTGFQTLREVRKPAHSVELAELMGILMGDGHLDIYQATVSTNSETDAEHAQYVADLSHTIFGLEPSIRKGRLIKVLTVTISSKMACDHLESLGMTRGNKLLKGLNPPEWIVRDTNYSTAFLRGLIDTDGCVYYDRHTIRGRKYLSTCIAFTNASIELLDFVQDLLLRRGFHPTRWGRHIRLRRAKEVLRYAKEVGFSNPKHSGKIAV